MGVKVTPTQLQALRKLNLTEEEIADVLATDEQIDKGAKLFELSPELEQGAKKARRADRTDTPKPATRERKEDTDKAVLLEQLVNGIESSPINATCEVVNAEREFLFTYNGRKFKVVLSAPRS